MCFVQEVSVDSIGDLEEESCVPAIEPLTDDEDVHEDHALTHEGEGHQDLTTESNDASTHFAPEQNIWSLNSAAAHPWGASPARYSTIVQMSGDGNSDESDSGEHLPPLEIQHTTAFLGAASFEPHALDPAPQLGTVQASEEGDLDITHSRPSCILPKPRQPISQFVPAPPGLQYPCRVPYPYPIQRSGAGHADAFATNTYPDPSPLQLPPSTVWNGLIPPQVPQAPQVQLEYPVPSWVDQGPRQLPPVSLPSVEDAGPSDEATRSIGQQTGNYISKVSLLLNLT
ncbi:hypothetical protein K474DRAFT_1671968 [Panus rudis PR-1116 ss-1]|nr:hypothetical protein K474DRAFT_1671968 [Panus rudis PR-1116 ss-1]